MNLPGGRPAFVHPTGAPWDQPVILWSVEG